MIFPKTKSCFFIVNVSHFEKTCFFGKNCFTFVVHLKLRVMKKRSFYAIVLVAIGLFLSINLGSFAVNSSSQSADAGGGNSSSMASGVYVPD
jgi:hypothetical protein